MSIVDKYPDWFQENADFEPEQNLPLSYINMIANQNDTYMVC